MQTKFLLKYKYLIGSDKSAVFKIINYDLIKYFTINNVNKNVNLKVRILKTALL